MKSYFIVGILISLSLPSLADKEYWVHEKDIMAKVVQLRKAKQALQNAIARKVRAGTDEELKAALEEIQNNYRHLEILRKEYREEMSHMRFEHPEGFVRGKEEVEVKYKALKLDELDREASESGVDLVLSEIKEQVSKAYDPLPKKEDPRMREKSSLIITPTTQPRRPKYSF